MQLLSTLTNEEIARLTWDEMDNLREARHTIQRIMDKAKNRRTINVLAFSSEIELVPSPWVKDRVKLIPISQTLPF